MLADDIHKCGFDNVSTIPTSDIPFDATLIKLCELNTCGNYGKSYTCPPHIGKTEDLVKKAKSYEYAVVFQKIYYISDSFDIEGMNAGKNDFKILMDKVYEVCNAEMSNYLILGAGGCTRCKICGVVDGVPCRDPKRAFPSLESYSIYVSELAKVCGMNYINGKNTVTYFGMVLF